MRKSKFSLGNVICMVTLICIYVPTLSCVYLDTPRVFSTKTQHFTPMFLKPGVEVHFFLKGSESSRDKNSETPNFKHFRPETSMGQLLKVLQNIFSNRLVSGKKWQNFV